MSSTALPTYASLLAWGAIVVAVIAIGFILAGMRENRGEVISAEPGWAVVFSFAALLCAWLKAFIEPETALWLALAIAVLALWGAAMDLHRLVKANRPIAGHKGKKRR